jgi:DNA-directed RNA polymerase subunit N (RpoN/RPB10)
MAVKVPYHLALQIVYIWASYKTKITNEQFDNKIMDKIGYDRLWCALTQLGWMNGKK